MSTEAKTTPPPPRGDTPPRVMRDVARELRQYAARWLVRANDLEDAADRLEGSRDPR